MFSKQKIPMVTSKLTVIKTTSIELFLNLFIYIACLKGNNVFFTGAAGSGKSYLLRRIISSFPPDNLIITASTGIAACLIGGITLHSFAGIGAGDKSLKSSVEMARRPASATVWRKCKRLIIDEISMVDAQFFDVSIKPFLNKI